MSVEAGLLPLLYNKEKAKSFQLQMRKTSKQYGSAWTMQTSTWNSEALHWKRWEKLGCSQSPNIPNDSFLNHLSYSACFCLSEYVKRPQWLRKSLISPLVPLLLMRFITSQMPTLRLILFFPGREKKTFLKFFPNKDLQKIHKSSCYYFLRLFFSDFIEVINKKEWRRQLISL